MPLNIQYGCGLSCPDGWVNFDASPTLRLQRLPLIGRAFQRGRTVFPAAVRYGDIRDGLPVADGSVDAAYASHVLEHLSLADFRLALINTFRMLKPGGIFRLIVPDLEVRARRYVSARDRGDPTANSDFLRASHLGVTERGRSVKALARRLFGNSDHLWMWDEGSMRHELEQVGFVDVRRAGFNDSVEPAFARVESLDRFHDNRLGMDECAMEARRPKVLR